MHAGDLQWRGATSAPFPGYLLIGRGEDFATHADLGQRRHHRPVRRDALRRQRHEVPVQGQVPRRWAPSTPARSTATRSRSGPPCTGRWSGYATVDGKKVAISSKRSSYGKDVARPALQPPALQRPGAQPEVVLEGRRADPADVQLLLHRQQAHRRVHGRPAADAQQERRPRPADHRAPASTSGAASCRKSGHPQGIDPDGRHDDQLEPDHAPRASAPPTTSGAATARSNGSTCSTRTSTGSPTKKGKWTLASVTVGDERRGDPGRPRDRHRSAAQAAAQGRQGPERRRRSRCST